MAMIADVPRLESTPEREVLWRACEALSELARECEVSAHGFARNWIAETDERRRAEWKKGQYEQEAAKERWLFLSRDLAALAPLLPSASRNNAD